MTAKSVQNLSLEDVIHKSLIQSTDDVAPLINYLKLDITLDTRRETAIEIANSLRKAGSNDGATLFRGGDGVAYSEVVFDVAKKLKAPDINNNMTVEELEEKIIFKLFADSLDKMTLDEKKKLFESMGISGSEIPFGASGLLLAQLALKHFAGFGVYKTTLIVSNMVARMLIGKGLSFAANAALTRSLGVFLGPVGWTVSGLWLAWDLAGPAYRKTVPAVIHIASLRQALLNRVVIGVVGDGSSGKDSSCKTFGIDTKNQSPVAGSTTECEFYPLGDSGAVELVNFPGFNDIDKSVNKHVHDYLHHVDVFIMVVDINRGVSNTDVAILEKLKKQKKPILICLNKIDLPRHESDLNILIDTAKERLTGDGITMIKTIFDPDPRFGNVKKTGTLDTYNWVITQLKSKGKRTDHIPRADDLS